ncbi:hypothetical protein MYXO_03998 [Myxococcaceae bacterium]|jgi:hypothetical protein|nr:hypothetical protein MYXO_03998 [Myxococcaceae bacterium]
MVHEHLKAVRLDRRTLRRRDWLAPGELAREFEALPDVSDKIDTTPPEAASETDGEAAKAGG